MSLSLLVLGVLGASVAVEPGPPESPDSAPAVPMAPTAAAVPPDPELVAWYQDMRLACSDRRAMLVARAQSRSSHEPGLLLGESTWAAAARSGAVSWAAATDPRVDDKALARTPEPADFRRLDTPSPAPQAVLEPDLPAEVLGRLRTIELCQGQADIAWRAWQAGPRPAERLALIEALQALQGLCTGVE